MFRSLHSLVLAEPVPTNSSIPQPNAGAPGPLADKVDVVLNFAAWIGTAAGVAGILVTGVMMAVSLRRGESSEHVSRLGMVLCGCVLIAAAGPLIRFVFGK